MLWVAFCLGFFGFMWSGETVAPADGVFDAGQHLTFADVSVDNVAQPTPLAIRIKQSTTDLFRQGATILVGKTCNSMPSGSHVSLSRFAWAR